MRTLLYYLIWIILIIASMMIAIILPGKLFGYDSLGIKGF